MIRHVRDGGRLRGPVIAVAGAVGALDLLALLGGAPRPMVDALVVLTLLVIALGLVAVLRSARQPRRPQEGAPRVLAIGAHPDDLELACGGTLAKLADSGFEIRALVMSAGQVGGDSSRRPDEARAGGRFLGVAEVEVLDFPDTALAGTSQEMVGAIEQRLNDFAPALILTHSEHDLHQDHHAVHLSVLRAARRRSSILCFESPSTTRDFNPSVFVDISDHLDIKVEGIRRHRDQRGKPYMGADTVRGAATFRGSQSRTAYAEGFEPVRLLADLPGLLAPALGGAAPRPAVVPAGTRADESRRVGSHRADTLPVGALSTEHPAPGHEPVESRPAARRSVQSPAHPAPAPFAERTATADETARVREEEYA
jgi:LmbE family N-acetylglucosaminyl deacetylase